MREKRNAHGICGVAGRKETMWKTRHTWECNVSVDLWEMGLWGCGLSESELDRDRWHTCEEGSEPCSSNSGNLL